MAHLILGVVTLKEMKCLLEKVHDIYIKTDINLAII